MYLNDVARLLPPLDAETGFEFVALAGENRCFHKPGARMGWSDLAPRRVGLQHEPVAWNRAEHLFSCGNGIKSAAIATNPNVFAEMDSSPSKRVL